MIILIIAFALLISVCFILFKLNLKRKTIRRYQNIEKLIDNWKVPNKNNINEYEFTTAVLTNISKKITGLFLISEFYFLKNDKTDSELNKLKDIYTEIIKKHPNFEKLDDVLFKYGNILFFEYFNFIESIKYYERLVKEFTNSKWLKVASARLKLIKSAYPNEEPALKKYALAEKYFKIQDYDKAIEYLKSVILIHPITKLAGTSCYFLGDIFFFKKGDYATALNYYSQIVEKIPTHPYAGNAQFKIGETYRKLNKINESIIAYKKFLENYNDFQYTDYAQYYIAQCYEEQKDWHLALRTYKMLIANYSDSIWIGISISKVKNLEKLVK